MAARLIRRTTLAIAVHAIAIVSAACGDGGTTAPAAEDADAGPDAATESAACPPPSYRGAADLTCVTGGYAACWEGTKPRANGWGCEAIIPEKACTGATRDALGEPNCVPIGDCNAPFPPSGATHFVAPLATVDATHFQTILAAIAAAPAGAVIAVDAGEYPDPLVLAKDVTIIARCPEKVLLGGSGRVQPLRVEGSKATVSGVTVHNSTGAVSIGPGAKLTLSDAVVENNDLTGIALSDGGGTVDMARVVVRGTRPGAAGRGPGLNAQVSSTVVAKDCAFTGNATQNLRISSRSTATLERVVVRDGRPTSTFDFGRGIQLTDGAKATITRSAFADNYDIGLVAGDGTTLDLHDVVVARTKIAKSGAFGRAINAFDGAIVTGDGVHIHDNHDASIMVSEPRTTLSLRRSSVVDTAFDRTGAFGRGITVQNGASLVFEDSAVVGSREVGVAVFTKGTQALLKRSIVTLTTPNATDGFGHGVMAALGGFIALEDCEVSSSTGTGIAIGDASARLARVRVRGNQVGLYLEDGTVVREVADGATMPAEREVAVTTDSVFEDNATRLSAGQLPLPAPLEVGTP